MITLLRRGVVSTSPNPQAGGPPLVGCPRLLIQYIRSYPPNWWPFVHPQLEDAQCCDDRDLHITENSLYSSPNIVRVRWARHVARKGDRRGVYRVLIGKPEGRRPLGRPRRRWEDNIKMDVRKVWMWGYGLDRAGSG